MLEVNRLFISSRRAYYPASSITIEKTDNNIYKYL